MQKKRNLFWYKIGYFINSIFALLLLFAYLIPYVKPDKLGGFAGVSLLTPVLILINIFFMIYWIIKLSRTFFLSFFILALGFPNLARFYKLAGKKTLLVDDVKVMSYNVRLFNAYQWMDKDSIPYKITTLVKAKAPDILSMQEYAKNPGIEANYPYKYIVYRDKVHQFGQAVFSKFKIIDKGNLDFKNTGNNILFADLKIGSDTVRIYNVHLQSLKINPKKENFGQSNTEKLRQHISVAFQEQQHQVEKLLQHLESVKYPVIITGDFNNTAFSWPYRSLLKGRKDAYVAAGKGFDKTFDFSFPIRIDFILLDKKVTVNHFKAYRDKFSDHYPIMARIDRKSLLSKDKDK
jgi:endonuclease/exonuclease/phosphatase family metal-dependent hydrolase